VLVFFKSAQATAAAGTLHCSKSESEEETLPLLSLANVTLKEEENSPPVSPVTTETTELAPALSASVDISASASVDISASASVDISASVDASDTTTLTPAPPPVSPLPLPLPRVYLDESFQLMLGRWTKLNKDFRTKSSLFDLSKVPEVYDMSRYEVLHNSHLDGEC
jgi:hypothetical protein